MAIQKAVDLQVLADRGEAGNDLKASALAGGRVVSFRFTLSALYPSLYQVMFDGDPIAAVWLWIDAPNSTQWPGVTMTIESSIKPGSFTFRVDCDVARCGLFEQPGDHALWVKGWRGEPGNDFAVKAVDREFRFIVPERQRPMIPAEDWKIPLCLFKLTPNEIKAKTLPMTEVRRVVDAVETDVFFNPADGNPADVPTSLAQWREGWERQYAMLFQWLRDAGLRAFIPGDSFYRSPAERGWFLKTPWASDAVAYVSNRCAGFRDVFVGFEGIDEFDGPTQFGKDTTVPDKFVAAWRSAPNHVPVSWPGWSIGNGITDDPKRADYVSRYPHAAGTWAEVGFGAEGSWTLPQIRRQVEGMCSGYNTDLPLCLMTTALPEWPLESVVAQYAIGLAGGARAFRCYHYADATSGGRGVRPGSQHWEALVRAANWVRKYEVRLGGHTRPLACHGPWAEGCAGGFRWLVNTTTVPQQCPHRGRLTTADTFDVGFRGGVVPPGGVLVLD